MSTIPTYTKSSLVIRNITNKKIDVLGVRLNPLVSKDLFIAVPGLTESKVLEAFRMPDGDIYKEVVTKRSVEIISANLVCLRNSADDTFSSLLVAGNINSSTLPIIWYLNDNSTGSLIFRAANKDILSLDTTDDSEGIEVGGYVSVDGYTYMNGPYSPNRISINSDHYVTGEYGLIGVDTSSVEIAVHLPRASNFASGTTFIIKDEAGNANAKNITVKPAHSSDTVDGSGAYFIAGNYNSITVYTNGLNAWFII